MQEKRSFQIGKTMIKIMKLKITTFTVYLELKKELVQQNQNWLWLASRSTILFIYLVLRLLYQ